MLGHPRHEVPTIAPLNPDPAQLFTGATEPRTEEPCPRGGRHGGGCDANSPKEPERINAEMPVPAFALFAALIAALPAQCRGLDALAVPTACGGLCVAARFLAPAGAQGIRQPLPVSAVAPWAEIPVDTGPLRILIGEHPPCEAPIANIKESLDHCPPIELAVAPTRLGRRDHIVDKIPCGISEVCGVWIGVHPQSVLS